jgi:hypothetical protein
VDVRELYQLARWFQERYPRLSDLYQGLLQPIQHNANQPNKQPFASALEGLIGYLKDMSFEELSLQQSSLLSSLGVLRYLGSSGADFVDSTVRTSDFDPATAAQQMQEAINSINSAYKKLTDYLGSVDELDVDMLVFDEPDDFITIRVGFRDKAAIENIVDWRDSGREWYDIVRGLALAAGESPEDTRVVGAGSGSIILFLAATATVTTLLAIISKNVTAVAKNVIGIQSEIENLRQKKLLTKIMGVELQKQITNAKSRALATVMAELKKELPKIDGEVTTALQMSVTKLLAFNEQGGNVDFVTPTDEDGAPDEGEETTGSHAALVAARAAIREYQAVRSELKLLTDASNDA